MTSVENKASELSSTPKEKKEESNSKERYGPYCGPFDQGNPQFNEYQNMYYDSSYPEQYQFQGQPMPPMDGMPLMPPMDPMQPIPPMPPMPPMDPMQPMQPMDPMQQMPPLYYSEDSQIPITDAPLYPQQPPFPNPEQNYFYPMPTPESSTQNNYYPIPSEMPQSEMPQPEISQPITPYYDDQKPQVQPLEQPVVQSIEQPLEQPVVQPVEQPLEQPVVQSVEQPVEQPFEQPIEQPIEQPFEQPFEQPIEQLQHNPNIEKEKEKYIARLKSILKNVNKNEYPTVEEKYIEWKIEDWNSLQNEEYSSEFITGDNKWKIKLLPNGNNYVSVYLENLNVKNDDLLHVIANYVISMRNYYDYSEYKANGSTIGYFNINKSSVGYSQFIEKSNLYEINNKTNKALVENNKTVIGAYIRVYKYNKKDQFIEEIKNSINDTNEVIEDNVFEWRIDNWNTISNGTFSPEFVSGGYKWKIKLYPDGFNNNVKDYVSVYLKNIDTENDETIHVYAKSIFFIRNYNDFGCLKTQGVNLSPLNYTKKSCIWGSHKFVTKDDLFRKSVNNNKSLVENNKTVIGVFIRIFRYTKEKFIEDLKKSIDNENLEVLKEGYHEWNIEDWSKLGNDDFSPEFTVADQKWKLQLYPNGYSDLYENYVSLFMDNVDALDEISNHLCIKRVFYIRNVKDYSIYSSETSNLSFYDKGCYSKGTGKLVKKTDLFSNKSIYNKTLIENNKVIIGTYIRAYKYNKDQYLKEIKGLIDDGSRETVDEDYFEWDIQDWDKLGNEIISPEFNIGGHQWRIKVYPNGNGQNEFLTMALRNESITEDNQFTYANFVISIRNTNDYSWFKTRELLSFRRFTKENNEFEMTKYTPKSFIFEKNNYYNKSIIEDGKATVGAYIRVYNSNIEREIEEKRSLKIPFIDN